MFPIPKKTIPVPIVETGIYISYIAYAYAPYFAVLIFMPGPIVDVITQLFTY